MANVFKKLMTALRGGVHEAAEAVADANGLRILDQEIRDASADQEKAKQALTSILARKALLEKTIESLDNDIASLSQKALKSQEMGNNELALEIAQAVGVKSQQRDAEKKQLDQFSGFAEKQKGTVVETDRRINQARQQAEMVKARESIQSAQKNVMAANGSTSGGLNNAMDSLNRIREKQDMAEAQMDAREALDSETSGKSLDAKMKDAGLVDDQYSAASILANLKKNTPVQ